MARRFTVALAVLAVAACVLLPGVASAQAGSPPAVSGTVIEAPMPAGQSLAGTGGDVIPMAIGAFALLFVGGMLVIATRRRRADSAAVSLA